MSVLVQCSGGSTSRYAPGKTSSERGNFVPHTQIWRPGRLPGLPLPKTAINILVVPLPFNTSCTINVLVIPLQTTPAIPSTIPSRTGGSCYKNTQLYHHHTGYPSYIQPRLNRQRTGCVQTIVSPRMQFIDDVQVVYH